MRAGGPDHDQLLRILDGQEAEHQLVDQGEDGGVGADSERERQHGHDRQHGRAAQERETRISGHTLIQSLKVDTKELIARLGFFRKREVAASC